MKPVLHKSDLIAREQQRYSIRKFTVGATSVLLGTTLFFVPAPEIVKADDHDNKGGSQAAIATIVKDDNEPTSSEIRPTTDKITVEEILNNQGDTEKLIVTPPASGNSSTSDTTVNNENSVNDTTNGDQNTVDSTTTSENTVSDIDANNGDTVTTDNSNSTDNQNSKVQDLEKNDTDQDVAKTVKDEDATSEETPTDGEKKTETDNSKDEQTEKDKTDALAKAKPTAKETKNGPLEPEKEYTELTADTDQINASNGKIILNLRTNEFEKGDSIQIIFHQKGKDLDATGTYRVEAGNNKDFADTTVGSYLINDLIVTNTFKESGTFNQYLILTTNTDFNSTILQKDGNFEQSIDVVRVTKNSTKLLKTITFKERVNHTTALYYRDIITTDPQPQYVKGNAILPNTNYIWHYDFQFNPNFNHGTEIVIPTPEHFVYDAEETKKASTALFNLFKGTASYENGKIRISLPALTNKELSTIYKNNYLYDGNRYALNLNMVGRIIQEQQNTSDSRIFANASPKSTTDMGTDKKATSTASSISVTLVGTDKNPDKLPTNKFLSSKTEPETYYRNELGNNEPAVSRSKTDDRSINFIDLVNNSAYGLNNVSANIDVPDGMDIRDFTYWQVNNYNKVGLPSHITYSFTLKDGTETETYESTADYRKNINLQSQPIKAIHIHADHVYAYQKFFSISLYGKLAPKYDNSNEVKVGDKLTTKANITVNDKDFHNQISQTVIDDTPRSERNYISIGYSQHSKDIGANKSGYIYFGIYNSNIKVTNMDFFCVLPSNATLNLDETIKNLTLDANISQFIANDHEVVKIHLNNVPVSPGASFNLCLNNSKYITKQNLEGSILFFVTLPSNEKDSYYPGAVPTVDKTMLAYVQNNPNSYSHGSGKWSILPATGTYTVSEAQGNQNDRLQQAGTSDDKQSTEMTFTNTFINGSGAILNNTVTLSNVPSTSDGKSEFDFYLTHPVNTIDLITGGILTNGVHYYYFEKSFDLDKINTNNDDWKQGALTVDQITDWNKIKAVAAVYDKMNADSVYQLQLHGYDPTLAYDAGKTTYMNNKTWSDLLKPTTYKAGDDKSASITVKGTSTVHTRFHYTDETGDHYIDAGDITLNDNDSEDQLTHYGVFNKIFNSHQKDDTTIKNGFFDGLNNTDQIYSMFPILKDYSIDIENPTISNSDHGDYPNGAKNETADWGIPRYYFDGDIITYELKKNIAFSKTIVIKRDVDYISTIDGHKLRDSTTEISAPASAVISGHYNPYTQYVTYNPISLPKELRVADIPDLNKNCAINGYIVANPDNILYGINSYHVRNYLSINTSLLFSKENIPIINVITKKSTSVQYLLDKNKTTDPNTIEFYLHQVLYYAPSYANLLALGVKDEPNKILEIAKSIDQDGQNATDRINFQITDDNLKRDGYSYQVYFYKGALAGLLNIPATNIPFYDFISKGYLEGLNSYDSLTEALRENSTYDTVLDGQLDNLRSKNDGSIAYVGDNSQNFFVVYTQITNELPQEAYILSDNDPYNNDEVTRPFAMSDSIETTNKKIADQVHKLLTMAEDKIAHLTPDDNDYYNLDNYKKLAQALKDNNYITAYKLIGKADSSLIKHLNYSRYNDFDIGTTISYLASCYDENGNRIYTIPFYDYDMDHSSQLSGSSLYSRAGYYIQSATYTDQYGHQITIKSNMENTGERYIDTYNTSDQSLLNILNYLTNTESNDSSATSPVFTVKHLGDNYTPSYEITIDGIKTYISTDDPDQIIIPREERLCFDNTDYDPNSGTDPKPQTIMLHYAPLKLHNDPSYPEHAVQIHYIDVTGMSPLSQETLDHFEDWYYFTLKPGTKYAYNYTGGQEFYFDPQTGELSNDSYVPIVYIFTEDHQPYDNSAIDAKIVQTLNKLGYVIVQRDSETTGPQYYNYYACDKSTHEFNGNYFNYSSSNSPQNYYVYFKRGQKVNYQAHLESPDGTVGESLQESTYLGIGEPGVNTKVGNAHTDLTNDKSPTFADLFKQVIADLESKYPNYRVVLSSDGSPVLIKSDDINELVFDPVNESNPDTPYRDLLLNLYMVQRQGEVAIHYIDVNDSSKSGDYTKDDGTEIEDYKQTITDKYIDDTYTNVLRDYAADHYVLAEEIDPKATSGTITRDAQDIYIFLKHERSTIKNPDSRTIKETINFVDENGNTLHDSYQAPDIVLTQIGYYDEHTKQNVVTGWVPEGPSFAAHALPDIDGYEVVSATQDGNNVLSADGKEVLPIDISSESQNIVVNVVYKLIKNTPDTPPTTPPSQPTEPTEPTQPTTTPEIKPEIPDIPLPEPEPEVTPEPVQTKEKSDDKQNAVVHATNMNTHKGKHYTSTTPVHATQVTPSTKKTSVKIQAPAQNSNQKQALPQTGEKSNKLGLIGLGFGLLAGLIGLIDFKRKKN